MIPKIEDGNNFGVSIQVRDIFENIVVLSFFSGNKSRLISCGHNGLDS